MADCIERNIDGGLPYRSRIADACPRIVRQERQPRPSRRVHWRKSIFFGDGFDRGSVSPPSEIAWPPRAQRPLATALPTRASGPVNHGNFILQHHGLVSFFLKSGWFCSVWGVLPFVLPASNRYYAIASRKGYAPSGRRIFDRAFYAMIADLHQPRTRLMAGFETRQLHVGTNGFTVDGRNVTSNQPLV